MATVITPEAMYFGAPASLTVGGIEIGATLDNPKFACEVETYTPDFKNAKGPVKGTSIVKKVAPRLECLVNELTAAKLAMAMPGCTATSSESVGQVRTGLDAVLAADPDLGAVILKVDSVTTVNVNDFIRVAAAGVAATEANSEILKVLSVGTTGSGGTGLGVENSAGGGCLLNHANAEEVKTVNGTILAAPAVAGATNVKVDSVSALSVGDFVRIGYLGHYETRQLTVVGTTGPAGTGITFAVPLTRDHALDEWVVEVTASGSTVITWTPGRVPSGAYQDVIATGPGLDGRIMTIKIFNAMSAQSLDFTLGDDAMTGLPLSLIGHYDPATPTVAPFSIELQ